MKRLPIATATVCALLSPIKAEDLTFNGKYRQFNCRYDIHLKCGDDGFCDRINSFDSTIINPIKEEIMVGSRWTQIVNLEVGPLILNEPMTGTFAINGVPGALLALRIVPKSVDTPHSLSLTASFGPLGGLEILAGSCLAE